MTPQDELRRAEKAEWIFREEVFTEAVEQIRQALLTAITKSAFVDEKLREKACQELRALENVLQCLKSTMETGILARKQLEIEEQQRTWRERAKAMF